MTEISMPLVSRAEPDRARHAAAGRAPGVEVRIVDEHDCEVPVGEVGELIVRTDVPWAMNHGYLSNPEATAAPGATAGSTPATASASDADGNFFFVDRHQGRDPPARREHLAPSRSRPRSSPTRRARGRRRRRAAASSARTRCWRSSRRVPGAALDPAELIEFLRPRMAALHGAALRPRRRRRCRRRRRTRSRSTCCAPTASRPAPGTARSRHRDQARTDHHG